MSDCPYGHERSHGATRNHAAEEREPLPDHDPSLQALGTRRENSSIPMDQPLSAESRQSATWTYPSERMFYNALRRKGYEPDADDIPPMLFIHNQLNERVWLQVVAWERVLRSDSCPISLERFKGRYGCWSPRSFFFARLLRCSPEPFDRHDWYVRRCDGSMQRYVIDYYPAAEPLGADASSDASSPESIRRYTEAVFNCDIRPAVDSIGGLWLRIKALFHPIDASKLA